MVALDWIAISCLNFISSEQTFIRLEIREQNHYRLSNFFLGPDNSARNAFYAVFAFGAQVRTNYITVIPECGRFACGLSMSDDSFRGSTTMMKNSPETLSLTSSLGPNFTQRAFTFMKRSSFWLHLGSQNWARAKSAQTNPLIWPHRTGSGETNGF